MYGLAIGNFCLKVYRDAGWVNLFCGIYFKCFSEPDMFK